MKSNSKNHANRLLKHLQRELENKQFNDANKLIPKNKYGNTDTTPYEAIRNIYKAP